MLKEDSNNLNPVAVFRQASAMLSLYFLAVIAAVALLDLLYLTTWYTPLLRALAGASGFVLCFISLRCWAVWQAKAEAAGHHSSVTYPEQVSQVPLMHLILCLLPTAVFVYIVWSAFRSGQPIWRLDHFDSDSALIAFLISLGPEISNRLYRMMK